VKTLSREVFPQAPSPIMTSFLRRTQSDPIDAWGFGMAGEGDIGGWEYLRMTF
jgi:hypothetical protein